RLSSQNLEHHHAASRTLALDRLAPVLHQLLHGVGDLFLRFAFYAITFWHISPSRTVRFLNSKDASTLGVRPHWVNPESRSTTEQRNVSIWNQAICKHKPTRLYLPKTTTKTPEK